MFICPDVCFKSDGFPFLGSTGVEEVVVVGGGSMLNMVRLVDVVQNRVLCKMQSSHYLKRMSPLRLQDM